MLLKKSSEVFRFLPESYRDLFMNLEAFSYSKIKSSKAKGKFLTCRPEGGQILMNVFILLFPAILKDKTRMRQRDDLFEPFVFIVQAA